MSKALKMDLDPIDSGEAQEMYHCDTDRLLRAAYLKAFTPDECKRCIKKFPQFRSWWVTLSERQKERVKGALAAEMLHLSRE
ncbi:hypothetical protein [Desulfopila sp. IMCC35008]|uniref:hypothetical protein n=1 Tax=Desulfopila sp. IMCC35008 TaxID=2653858 RepID=UPI0013D29637|nr:hypothetical protein [Desulfopila sp. IMCC35008]